MLYVRRRMAGSLPRHARSATDGGAGRERALRRAMLRWWDAHGRRFFWREPGMSPFAVLVVEVLLAKTRAEVVAPVAPVLLSRFPSASALARANPRTLERVLYPLGLHRKRARQLIACAAVLAREHGGEVPGSEDALLELPGVGRYAANAVLSVAFGQRRPVIDANVARIFGRVFALAPPPPRLSAAHDLWGLAARLLPRRRSKEFTWALLDLGSMVCIAQGPACADCPLQRLCAYSSTRAEAVRNSSSPRRKTGRFAAQGG